MYIVIKIKLTKYIEVQDFVCEVASCLYKSYLFLTGNQPEIHSSRPLNIDPAQLTSQLVIIPTLIKTVTV